MGNCTNGGIELLRGKAKGSVKRRSSIMLNMKEINEQEDTGSSTASI